MEQLEVLVTVCDIYTMSSNQSRLTYAKCGREKKHKHGHRNSNIRYLRFQKFK
jgi:hypothetical protein